MNLITGGKVGGFSSSLIDIGELQENEHYGQS